jgi:transposase InsO family protein
MKFAFIEAHRRSFPVQSMCKVLQVSRSGYYAWRKRPVSKREMANQVLVKQIQTVYEESFETYGSPRIYEELKAQGIRCSENRVARLMRWHGIQAKQTKRFKVTTKANRQHPVAPNLLRQQFTASQPDEKWLADISYIDTREGWLYLAAVMDLFSRRIVGWAMASRMTKQLVIAALKMALRQRRPPEGLLHHSDQGSQYTGTDYQQLLHEHKIQVSMNSVGNYYDNAPMESFFGTLKQELVHNRSYQTRAEARTDIFYYLEAFYNRRRRHSSLDYLSPDDFERDYFCKLTTLSVY